MIRRQVFALLVLGAALPFAAPAARAQAPDTGGVPYNTSFTVAASPELAARVPERVRKAGVLTVATNPNTPPTVFITEDNRTLAGREIDVMSAVVHRLGLEPHWVNAGGFGNIVPGLSSGRYDAALANLSVTPERLKQVDFVSYFNSNLLGMVRSKGNGAPAPAPESGTNALADPMTLCGETIGAGSGTMNAETLRRQSTACTAAGRKPIEVPLFPSRPAGVQAVISGRVPGFFGPLEGLRYMVSVSRGTLELAGVYQVPNDFIGIGLQKDSPLTPLVAAALSSLMQDGTYAAILRKWDLEYGALPAARENGAILEGAPPEAAARGG